MNPTQPSAQWLQLTVHTPSPLIEAVSDLLGVLSGSAVEESPDKGDGSMITGFFQLEADQESSAQVATLSQEVRSQLERLFALYEMQPGEISTSLIDDQDWSTSWQQFFNTFEIAPGLVIKPSWEEYTPEPGQQVLEMDPGMAFGTGQHASTKLALQLLAQTMKTSAPTKRILDVGTGTGILAMAGALFGAEAIIAIDNDPEAVEVAEENIRHNNLDTVISVSDTPFEAITERYEIICANIIHNVLVEMAPDMVRCSAPGGAVIVAGILAGNQEESIIARYAQDDFSLADARYEQEWVALLFRNDRT